MAGSLAPGHIALWNDVFKPGIILAFPVYMQAILAFYRNFVWSSAFITIFGCYLIVAHGSWAFIAPVFWMKVLTNIVLGLYTHIFRAEQYCFFLHFGFDKARLYMYTFTLDMMIWLMLSVLTIKLFL